MRLLAAVLVGALATGSLAMPTLPALPPAWALGMAVGVAEADSWMGRLGALSPVLGSVEPVPFVESRSVPVLIDELYAHLGVAMTPEQRADVEAQLAALDPRLHHALQQLLGAIELGFVAHREATAAWTPEDWEALRDAFLDWDADVSHILAKADGAPVRESALRLVGVIDALTPLLEEVALDLPSDLCAPEVVPNPNDCLLFNDPFNLVIVGGPGDSVYRQNTFPLPRIHPGKHILILDPAGNDVYNSIPATGDGWVCNLWYCTGVPVSVAVDVVGNDVWQPTIGDRGGALGFGGFLAVGILAELSGNDVYRTNTQVSLGFSWLGGWGFLLDGQGNDVLHGLTGSMGGTFGTGSHGIMMDVGGSDAYYGTWDTQGYAQAGGVGLFVDVGGDDIFSSSLGYAQGAMSSAGGNQAVGVFLSVGGGDSYFSRENSRGWASTGLGALFLDVCGTGTDRYQTWPGADGGSWSQGPGALGFDVNAPVLDCAAYE